MTKEPTEILGSFCAPSHSLVNTPNLLVEIRPCERNFQGRSGTILEDKYMLNILSAYKEILTYYEGWLSTSHLSLVTLLLG